MPPGCRAEPSAHEWALRRLHPPRSPEYHHPCRIHSSISRDERTSATNAYFADQDTVRQWAEDCCDTTDRPPHVADTSSSLFASWRAYAHARGEEAGGAKGFATKLQNLGFEPIKDECGIRGRRGFPS